MQRTAGKIRRSAGRCVCVAIVLLVIATKVTSYLHSSSASLLGRCATIASISDLTRGRSLYGGTPESYEVEWIDNERILLVAEGVSSTGFTLDTRRGTVAQIPQSLSNKLGSAWGRSRLRLRSQGALLLWMTSLIDTTELHSASLDGTVYSEVGRGSQFIPLVDWLPNNPRGWLEVVGTRSWESGNASLRYRIVCHFDTRREAALPLPDEMVGCSLVLDRKTRLHAYRSSIFGRSESLIRIMNADLSNHVVVRREIITLPFVCQCVALEWSPSGDQIAMLLVRTRPLGPIDFVRRIFRTPVSSRMVAAIWVSRADGSAMREVGNTEVQDVNELRNLRWTPDGKHLSFTYRDKILSALSPL